MGKREVDQRFDTDILVIGAGLAGACAAVKAREAGIDKILLVEKGRVARTGMSVFGAGRMTVKFPDDDREIWMKEALEHAEYLADQEWLQIMLEQGYAKAKELASWGVEFQMKDGDFLRAVGRGSCEERLQRDIMFKGPQMMDALREKLLAMNTKLVERVTVTDLLTSAGRIGGAIGFNSRTGESYLFRAKAVINAAGSNAYKGTYLGHRNVTGDAWAMMYRVGAAMISMEFATANSTSRDYDLAGMGTFVGLGGKFTNRLGERFMERYDPIYKDRAGNPRLTAAMAMEVKEGRGPIYIDMRHLTEDQIKLLRYTNPIPMNILDHAGIDLRKQPIEWMPAMIGFGSGRAGGAWINTSCATNIPGLYAVGDAAWASFQGVGAAGGLNFPFCAVSAEIAVEQARNYIREVEEPRLDESQLEERLWHMTQPLATKEGMLPQDVLYRFQKIMFRYGTLLIRHGDRLKKALEEIERIRDKELPMLRARDVHELRNALELENMVTSAEMVLRSALVRTESRGGNIREDYPEIDNVDWLKWVVVKNDGGKMAVSTVEIPVERYPIKPKREKFLHPIFAGAKKFKEVQGGS